MPTLGNAVTAARRAGDGLREEPHDNQCHVACRELLLEATEDPSGFVPTMTSLASHRQDCPSPAVDPLSHPGRSRAREMPMPLKP